MPLIDLRSQALRRTADEMLEHLRSFDLDLKFSAGFGSFSPPQSRFPDRYKPMLELPARLDIAARMKDYGLSAMEAHYPNEINEGNLDLWQQFMRDTGIRLLTVIPLLFWDDTYEWGSLSSPIESVRRSAMERAKSALRLNRELNTDFAVVWPGIDGYENAFGMDLGAARPRCAAGLAEALDAVPGVRIAFEPKPYEPRGHILYGLTSEGILLGMKTEAMLLDPANRKLLDDGHALVGLNPEVGHMLMGYEDLPYAYSLGMEYGRLAHTHWNSQPLGNFDQDLNVGVVSVEAAEAALYALKMHGYTGYFGIDINPERMPVDTALKISMDALRAANDRINCLDHESVLYATNHPDRSRGWLEAYLVRVRAGRPEQLTPLPPLKTD